MLRNAGPWTMGALSNKEMAERVLHSVRVMLADMHVSTLDQLRAVMEELTGAECVSQVALSSTLDFPEEYGLTREGAALIRSTVEGVH